MDGVMNEFFGKVSYTGPSYTAQWYSVACIKVARYLDRPTIEVTGKAAINQVLCTNAATSQGTHALQQIITVPSCR